MFVLPTVAVLLFLGHTSQALEETTKTFLVNSLLCGKTLPDTSTFTSSIRFIPDMNQKALPKFGCEIRLPKSFLKTDGVQLVVAKAQFSNCSEKWHETIEFVDHYSHTYISGCISRPTGKVYMIPGQMKIFFKLTKVDYDYEIRITQFHYQKEQCGRDDESRVFTCKERCMGGYKNCPGTHFCMNPKLFCDGFINCIAPLPSDEASCSLTGNWCDWGEWNPCTRKTCGSVDIAKVQTRTRACGCLLGQTGASGCAGSRVEARGCQSNYRCASTWCPWSRWMTTCTNCKGTADRRRTCNCLAPVENASCAGSTLHMMSCPKSEICKQQTLQRTYIIIGSGLLSSVLVCVLLLFLARYGRYLTRNRLRGRQPVDLPPDYPGPPVAMSAMDNQAYQPEHSSGGGGDGIPKYEEVMQNKGIYGIVDANLQEGSGANGSADNYMPPDYLEESTSSSAPEMGAAAAGMVYGLPVSGAASSQIRDEDYQTKEDIVETDTNM